MKKEQELIQNIQGAIDTIRQAAPQLDACVRGLRRGARTAFVHSTQERVIQALQNDGEFAMGATLDIEKATAYAEAYDALTPETRKTLSIPETPKHD